MSSPKPRQRDPCLPVFIRGHGLCSTGARHKLIETIEVFGREILDFDLAPLSVSRDSDASAKLAFKFDGGGAHIRIHGQRLPPCWPSRLVHASGNSLCLTDGKAAVRDSSSQPDLPVLVLDAQQSTRMAGRQLSFFDHLLNPRREAQKPQGICHCHPIDTEAGRDLVVAQAKAVLENLVGSSRLQRSQVIPEQILGERELQRFTVVQIEDDGRQGAEICEPGCAPASLTCHKLVAAGHAPDEDGLDYPFGSDRICELLELSLIERGARLERVRVDLLDRDTVGSLIRLGYRRGLGLPDQSAEAPPQRLASHDG